MRARRLRIRHAAQVDAGHITHIIGRHLHAHFLPHERRIVIHHGDVFFDNGDVIPAQGIDMRRYRQIENVERTLALLRHHATEGQQGHCHSKNSGIKGVGTCVHHAVKDTQSFWYNGKMASEV